MSESSTETDLVKVIDGLAVLAMELPYRTIPFVRRPAAAIEAGEFPATKCKGHGASRRADNKSGRSGRCFGAVGRWRYWSLLRVLRLCGISRPAEAGLRKDECTKKGSSLALNSSELMRRRRRERQMQMRNMSKHRKQEPQPNRSLHVACYELIDL